MKQRKNGLYEKAKTINGKKIHFYSSAKTERAAQKDIEAQMITYTDEAHRSRHNFKCLAEQALEEKEQTVSNATMQTYIHTLKHLKPLYDMDIENISVMTVQGILNGMAKQKYSLSAIRKVKVLFGVIMDYAIINGLQLYDFTNAIKIPKMPPKIKEPTPNDTVIATIIQNANTQDFGMWAMMLLCTGMRRGELCGIQRKNIDLKNGVIHIEKSVEFVYNQPHVKDMPKTLSGIRDIPILSILRQPLLEMCFGLAPDDFLFGGQKPLSETQIKKRWAKYCKETGLDIHQHQLRHCYAKLLYRSGVDPKTAQGLLGHSDITVTMNIYTEFADDVTEQATEKLNNFLNTIIG